VGCARFRGPRMGASRRASRRAPRRAAPIRERATGARALHRARASSRSTTTSRRACRQADCSTRSAAAQRYRMGKGLAPRAGTRAPCLVTGAEMRGEGGQSLRGRAPDRRRARRDGRARVPHAGRLPLRRGTSLSRGILDRERGGWRSSRRPAHSVVLPAIADQSGVRCRTGASNSRVLSHLQQVIRS
jgi:hypothetical protein